MSRIFAKTLLFLFLFSSVYSEEIPWWEKDLPDGRIADFITKEDLEGCSEEEQLYHPPWTSEEDDDIHESNLDFSFNVKASLLPNPKRDEIIRRQREKDELERRERENWIREKLEKEVPTKSLVPISQDQPEPEPEPEPETTSPEPESSESSELESSELAAASKHLFHEENNPSLTTLEAGPSAIVGNCVNAITGDFFESQIDLVVSGPVPLVVQRTYCSSAKKWQFRHMPSLLVGFSKGKNHICAGYQDDNGSGMTFRSPWDGHRNTVKQFFYT